MLCQKRQINPLVGTDCARSKLMAASCLLNDASPGGGMGVILAPSGVGSTPSTPSAAVDTCTLSIGCERMVCSTNGCISASRWQTWLKSNLALFLLFFPRVDLLLAAFSTMLQLPSHIVNVSDTFLISSAIFRIMDPFSRLNKSPAISDRKSYLCLRLACAFHCKWPHE